MNSSLWRRAGAFLAVRWSVMAWLAAAALPVGVRAAAPVPGGELGYNAAMAQLFADTPYFAANVETTLTNLTDKTRLSVPMRMLKRQEMLRIEVDFVKLKGSGLALQGLSALQNIGMARMTSLVDPRAKGMTVFFPDLKAYTKVSMSEADLPEAGFKVAKKAMGKQTVDGQPCVRQQVTLTSPDGTRVEATTWEATALGNFPIRMHFRQSEGSLTMNFRNVELKAPADELFKVPSDHKSYDGISALMQDAMARVLTGAGK